MLFDFLINMVNHLLFGLSEVFKFVINLLPNSPFLSIAGNQAQSNVILKYLGTLNWIIPFDVLINITFLWVSAIGIYYLYQVVLRWVKAIQ